VFDEGKRIYDSANLLATEFTERFNSLSKEGNVFSFFKNQFLSLESLKQMLGEYKQVKQ
jgi:hypothetical protein